MVLFNLFITKYTNNQVISLFLALFQKLNVARIKDIETSRSIYNSTRWLSIIKEGNNAIETVSKLMLFLNFDFFIEIFIIYIHQSIDYISRRYARRSLYQFKSIQFSKWFVQICPIRQFHNIISMHNKVCIVRFKNIHS